MMQFSDLPALPYAVPDSVMDSAKAIKLALFDVDGVLTDGSLHYGTEGEQTKAFNALDGHGLKMLQNAGIAVGVISARNSAALRIRMADLGVTHSYLGVPDKQAVFRKLIGDLGFAKTQCCFTGDDVIDLPVMLECGLKFSVLNAHFIVRELADWVAPFAGGQGAVRAICDLLLYSQQKYPLGIAPQQ